MVPGNQPITIRWFIHQYLWDGSGVWFQTAHAAHGYINLLQQVQILQ